MVDICIQNAAIVLHTDLIESSLGGEDGDVMIKSGARTSGHLEIKENVFNKIARMCTKSAFSVR